MAYLAMARKWRPKNFEDMVGQDHIAQTIRNAIEGKRISHAYLFTGTRGVGKTTSARILAKALNCKNGPTPVPCDACENCKAVNNGSSLDVLEIDGASNNGVDNIRELREQANYAPMNGTYKIYVIDEVHMLSKGAFNALLKTLEEPPPHVVFIFATTESNKLPHTILSRVQRFDFKRISERHIRERLEYICAHEEIKPEREALEAIARKADGSMRDALSLFDQVYAFSGADLSMEAARKVLGLPRDTLFDGLLRALIQHDQKTCFASVQEAHQEGIETSALLIAFGEYLRNMLFARQGVGPGALGLGEQRYGELVALAPELRDGDLIRFAKMVSDMLAQLRNSANPRLAVELGFARMAALDRVVTLSQVLGQDHASIPAARESVGSGAGGSAAPLPREQARAHETAQDLAEVKKKKPSEPLGNAGKAMPPAAALPGPQVQAGPEGPGAERPEMVPAPARPMPPLEFAPEAQRLLDFPVSDFAAQAAPTAVLSPAMARGPEADAAGEPAPPSALSRIFPETGGEMELETDGEPERDLEMDPEDDPGFDNDPEGRLAPAPARTAAETEPMVVPAQDSPERLPELWPALVGEFMALRPLMGSHLRRTKLVWEAGDAASLRVTFMERSAFSLIGDDADFRKSIQSFLASKSAEGREVPVRFALDEAAGAGSPMESIPVPFGAEDPARREPIINFIRDIFEARIVG